jgi:hypothetical protein
VGIGILKTNAGIGIPASVISVRCRTASLYSGTGTAPASFIFFSPVPDCLDAGLSGIPVVKILDVSFLKGQCHESFDLRFFSHPTTPPGAKAFFNSTSNSPRYDRFSNAKILHAVSSTSHTQKSFVRG